MADASFVMVLVSTIWVLVDCCKKGFPALNQVCALPEGCVLNYDDYSGGDDYGGSDCASCAGKFAVSGFNTQGRHLLCTCCSLISHSLRILLACRV